MTRETTAPGKVISNGNLSALARLLLAPHVSIADRAEQRRARLLALISAAVSAVVALSLLFRPSGAGLVMALLVVVVSSYFLSRTRRYNAGSVLFCFGLALYAYLSIFFGLAASLQAAMLGTVVFAVIAGSAVLTRKNLIVLGIAATALALLAPAYSKVPADGAFWAAISILFVFVVLYGLELYRESQERSRLNELSALKQEIETIKAGLESHIRERTAELQNRTEELALRSKELGLANSRLERRATQFEAISEVSKSIASIRDLNVLLPEVARLISQHFGFYHVGIFLLDEAGQYAVLTAANSEGGQRMLERKHRLRIGQEGIVGFVTATGKVRVALDVGADAVFFNNPDLPQTHSEMALPLKTGGQIAGALDVQSMETNAFSNEDIQLLSLLADQVSLAIENALLFQETQRSLSEAESFGREYLRQAWQRLATDQQLVGYRYDVAGATPLAQPIRFNGSNGASVQPETSQVTVPIELRGEAIGELIVQAPAGRKWSPEELDLIKAVAERVALSAENARLFEETNRRAERERMVSEITSKIRSTNDPSEMIRTAVQELKNALGVSRVEVLPQKVSGKSEL